MSLVRFFRCTSIPFDDEMLHGLSKIPFLLFDRDVRDHLSFTSERDQASLSTTSHRPCNVASCRVLPDASPLVLVRNSGQVDRRIIRMENGARRHHDALPLRRSPLPSVQAIGMSFRRIHGIYRQYQLARIDRVAVGLSMLSILLPDQRVPMQLRAIPLDPFHDRRYPGLDRGQALSIVDRDSPGLG